jgi:RNA polymerase sigma factor (sigma-70 family)|tara:strand:- start:265 stop:933 length:669 start_codon:yes stop_codon:yes gene_type:complete
LNPSPRSIWKELRLNDAKPLVTQMNADQEKELVNRCLDGDETAWSELYREFYSQIRYVVGWKRWGFSKGEVEDGIQEVFTELVRSLPNFRQESKLSTFVERLARNRCISHLRKKTALKRPKESLGVELEEGKGEEGMARHHLISEDGDPEGEILASEQFQELSNALAGMGEGCRQIITLRYYRQMSYQEICAVMELPLGTVCSRLKRCLAKLKTKILSSEAI